MEYIYDSPYQKITSPILANTFSIELAIRDFPSIVYLVLIQSIYHTWLQAILWDTGADRSTPYKNSRITIGVVISDNYREL